MAGPNKVLRKLLKQGYSDNVIPVGPDYQYTSVQAAIDAAVASETVPAYSVVTMPIADGAVEDDTLVVTVNGVAHTVTATWEVLYAEDFASALAVLFPTEIRCVGNNTTGVLTITATKGTTLLTTVGTGTISTVDTAAVLGTDASNPVVIHPNGVPMDYARDAFSGRPLRFAPDYDALLAAVAPSGTTQTLLTTTNDRFRVNVSLTNTHATTSRAIVSNTYTIVGTKWELVGGGAAVTEVITVPARARTANTDGLLVGTSVRFTTNTVFAAITSITLGGSAQTADIVHSIGIEGDIADGVMIEGEQTYFDKDAEAKTVIPVPMVALRIDDIRKKLARLAVGTPIVWPMTATRSGWTQVATGDGDYYRAAFSGDTDLTVTEKVDALPSGTLPTYAARIQMDDSLGTEVLGYWSLSSNIDMTSMTHFSAWMWNDAAAFVSGAVRIGFSQGTDFSSPSYIDIPAVPGLGQAKMSVIIALTAEIKAMTSVKTVGIATASDVGASTVVFKMYGPRVAAHPCIGISPLRYAAQKGVPITHACIVDEIGARPTDAETAIMTADDLWQAVNLRGSELAAHTQYGASDVPVYNGVPNLARANECTIGTKVAIGAIAAATTGAVTNYTPAAVGTTARGYIQPGLNEINLNTRATMFGWFGQIVQKYFDWGMAYLTKQRIRYGATTTVRVGANIGGGTQALVSTYAEASPPTNNIIIADHYVVDTVSDNTKQFTYAQWVAMIDRLDIWQRAGKVVCVSLSTYFDALQPATFASLSACPNKPVYGGDCANETVGWSGASNVTSVGEKFETSGTYGYIASNALAVIPGHRYALAMEGSAEAGTALVIVRVVYNYLSSEGVETLGCYLPICQTLVGTVASIIGGCFSVPTWASQVKIELQTYPQPSSKAYIDNVAIREI